MLLCRFPLLLGLAVVTITVTTAIVIIAITVTITGIIIMATIGIIITATGLDMARATMAIIPDRILTATAEASELRSPLAVTIIMVTTTTETLLK